MNRSIKFFGLRFLLMVAFVFTTLSCSETDSPSLDVVPSGLYIKFKSNTIQYLIQNPITLDLSNKKIDGLQGAAASLVSITLYMPLNPTIGSHFMIDSPSDDSTYGAYFVLGNSVNVIANAGIITITSITADYISGTFSFSGLNGTSAVVEVTNGSFVANVD